ncbi:MAG: cytidylate kinase-like family protein [Treponema sp.]|jgi:cytidylate kinase|nr:cytidylate kinase-like family protein [Treponema sp.]
MAVITISRELAALGDETAHELGNLLKYRFVDKHSLEERMKKLGVNARKIEKYDERKPTLFASLSQDRDEYLHYLKTAIFSEAGQGSCVLMGRGCEVILKELPAVFSVFLAAPFEIRVQRVKGYFHCDEHRARQIIEQSDRDREGFHRYFFESKWKNPSNYHLSLNTGMLHPELCADIIRGVLEKTIDKEKETNNALMIKDRILGQQVLQYILVEKKIPVHFLEAQAASGVVTLFGVASSQAAAEAAVQIAQEVPAVVSVKSEIQLVQEYNIMP